MSVKKRIIRGLSAGLLGTGLHIVIQLISLPILLHYWGTEYYGEWLVLFAFPSYVAMSDIGLGTVVTTEINKLNAVGQIKKARFIFNQTFNLILLVGISVTLIFFILIYIPGFKNLLNIQKINSKDFLATASILAIYSFGSLILSLPAGLYRAIGLYHRGQNIQNIFRIVETLAFLGSIFIGGKVLSSAIIFLFVRIVQSVFIYYDLKNRTHIINFSLRRVKLPIVKPFLSPSISMMTFYLGQSFLVQGMIITINITLGGAAVTVFTTIRTLCNFAKQMISIINLAFFAEFTQAYAQKNYLLTTALLKRSNQLIILSTIIATITLYLFGSTILKFWTSNEVQMDHTFFLFFLLSIITNSIWYIRWGFLLALNEHGKTVIPYLIGSIVSLIITYFLSHHLGMWVAGASLLFIDLIMVPVVYKESNIQLKKIK